MIKNGWNGVMFMRLPLSLSLSLHFSLSPSHHSIGEGPRHPAFELREREGEGGRGRGRGREEKERDAEFFVWKPRTAIRERGILPAPHNIAR